MSILCFKEKDGTLNVMVAGRVQKAPMLTAGGRKLGFSVRYGKGKFMNVDAWENSGAWDTAGMLEKDDAVAVIGVHTSREHDGKTYESLNADIILTGVTAVHALEHGQTHNPGDTWEETEDGLPFS